MADAPGEGTGISPVGVPPAAVAPADVPPAASSLPRVEAQFGQALSLSRIFVIVPVIVLLLSALASFAYGTYVFINSVTGIVDDRHLTHGNLGFLLLLTDLFLVGATLMIAAFGLYELFIGRIRGRLVLPGWLRMHDLNDLKARVISMIILVAAVSFVDEVIESKDGLDTLYVGGGIALVIAALTGFLHYGRTDGNDR
jgi:uncharacterized membrane protein YqhA